MLHKCVIDCLKTRNNVRNIQMYYSLIKNQIHENEVIFEMISTVSQYTSCSSLLYRQFYYDTMLFTTYDLYTARLPLPEASITAYISLVNFPLSVFSNNTCSHSTLYIGSIHTRIKLFNCKKLLFAKQNCI